MNSFDFRSTKQDLGAAWKDFSPLFTHPLGLKPMPAQPMAEVFGFQINDISSEAQRHRQNRLCPFNNVDFGALEVQAVYISGNIRRPFAYYMQDPIAHAQMRWDSQRDYPRADYLSSSRKRLAPQLIYKGGILHSWKRKMAVAIDSGFFGELPVLPQVPASQADVAWLIYDLQVDKTTGRYRLAKSQVLYTQFTSALQLITTAVPGSETDFLQVLQRKLDEKQVGAAITPDTTLLLDVFTQADDSEE